MYIYQIDLQDYPMQYVEGDDMTWDTEWVHILKGTETVFLVPIRRLMFVRVMPVENDAT